MFFSKILVGLESQVFFSFSLHPGQFTSSSTGFSNCSLESYFGICSYLTASCLPLLATVEDKNYSVKSNYRSSEWNLASAARKQLWTHNCRPALLFQQYVIKALVCSEESLLYSGVTDWIDCLNNSFCLRFGWVRVLVFSWDREGRRLCKDYQGRKDKTEQDLQRVSSNDRKRKEKELPTERFYFFLRDRFK